MPAPAARPASTGIADRAHSASRRRPTTPIARCDRRCRRVRQKRCGASRGRRRGGSRGRRRREGGRHGPRRRRACVRGLARAPGRARDQCGHGRLRCLRIDGSRLRRPHRCHGRRRRRRSRRRRDSDRRGERWGSRRRCNRWGSGRRRRGDHSLLRRKRLSHLRARLGDEVPLHVGRSELRVVRRRRLRELLRGRQLRRSVAVRSRWGWPAAAIRRPRGGTTRRPTFSTSMRIRRMHAPSRRGAICSSRRGSTAVRARSSIRDVVTSLRSPFSARSTKTSLSQPQGSTHGVRWTVRVAFTTKPAPP